MAIFTTVLITAMVLSGTLPGNANTTAIGTTRVADVLSVGGYWLFVALILGLIAATAGGRQGGSKGIEPAINRPEIPEIRRAA
jgi:hypothetical protein